MDDHAEQVLGKRDWLAYLMSERRPLDVGRPSLDVLDLFSGVGGLALGFARAAGAAGYETRSLGAVDSDPDALTVYSRNLATSHPIPRSVSSLVDFQVRGSGDDARFLYAPEMTSEGDRFVGRVDALLAGPPCQGNSSL